MKHKPDREQTSIPVIILAGGQSNRLRVGDNLKWQLPFFRGYLADEDSYIDSSSNSPFDHLFVDNNAPPVVCHKQSPTLLSFIIDRLKMQTNRIIINGPHIHNSDLETYNLPIIADLLPDFQGPLSGILTALHWAKKQNIAWVATVSCDTPFFPKNLLQTLSDNIPCNQPENPLRSLPDRSANSEANNKAAIAIYQQRTHPTFGLWSQELYEPLKYALTVDANRAVNRWALRHAKKVKFEASTEACVSAGREQPFENSAAIDPFFNINNLHDYKQALSYLT
ncbi:MAG: molybdopterin-guanine dinucleotide biosynthesis protein A [Pseudohongiellaceae bacterium]|jgi:molybdopterin-guanine dinucleotide biosynthesis protein A